MNDAWSFVSDEGKDLVRKCLTGDADMRVTVNQGQQNWLCLAITICLLELPHSLGPSLVETRARECPPHCLDFHDELCAKEEGKSESEADLKSQKERKKKNLLNV